MLRVIPFQAQIFELHNIAKPERPLVRNGKNSLISVRSNKAKKAAGIAQMLQDFKAQNEVRLGFGVKTCHVATYKAHVWI